MAVCGRCWLCGTKFSCNLKDVGAVVLKIGIMDDKPEPLPGDLNDSGRKLCTSCVDAIDGNLFLNEENEPHGDGRSPSSRLVKLIGLLALSVEARALRGEEG